MPGIRFPRLVDDFVENLERLGATVIRDRATERERPARIRVVSSDGTTDCLLYFWTITPGGGPGGERPANERRIQATNPKGVPLEIALEPGKRTLFGGWNPEAGVWCFWDARRHTRFSSRSNSVQVSSDTLEQAESAGIASYVKPSAMGSEVVMAVNPDSLLWYVQNGAPLHNSDDDARAVNTLIDASPEEERNFLDTSESEDEILRRHDLVTTIRSYRDARFRPAVLRAYRFRCAVCQCALKLVDAAHIIPVADPRSKDDVTNGLALCRLHHGAFDNGLLGVQSDYRVVVNPEQADNLARLGLDMGINEFRDRLPSAITLPASIEVRPRPENLLIGLQLRRWPESLIA